MISTQILTHNDEKTIENTLKSLLPLKSKILICDLGSNDNTLKICSKYTNLVIKSNNDSRNDIRNDMLNQQDDWIFYILPGEILVEPFALPLERKAYHFPILYNNVITKDVRLWHKSCNLKFSNPICETIDCNTSEYLDSMIYCVSQKSPTIDEIEKWSKRDPTSCSPFYYKAFWYLGNKKYKEFLSETRNFLFREQDGIPASIIRYYSSLLILYMYKDTEYPMRSVNRCLNDNFMMSEFWCLAGDIMYQKRNFKNAISLYENAIIIGKQRLKSDRWPMDVSKYKDYPNIMINKCNKIMNESVVLSKF